MAKKFLAVIDKIRKGTDGSVLLNRWDEPFDSSNTVKLTRGCFAISHGRIRAWVKATNLEISFAISARSHHLYKTWLKCLIVNVCTQTTKLCAGLQTGWLINAKSVLTPLHQDGVLSVYYLQYHYFLWHCSLPCLRYTYPILEAI